MSKEKEERRRAAGPAMDPMQISMQMSPLPGSPPGPGNMNGNPMNATDFGSQQSSMSPDGSQESIYRDGRYLYPQMGANILNPMNVGRSQVQQNTPMTSVGKNRGVPFGLQMQPPTDMGDTMESGRLAGTAQSKGLMPSAMGMSGMPAVPGSIDPTMGGNGNHIPMNSMNPMTPGADKTVIKKKGKK